MVYLLVARCVAWLGLYLFGCFSWVWSFVYFVRLLVVATGVFACFGVGWCCDCLTLLGLFCVLLVCFGCGVGCACLRPFAV